MFKEPVLLRKGSAIVVTGYFTDRAAAARGLRVTLIRYLSSAPYRASD